MSNEQLIEEAGKRAHPVPSVLRVAVCALLISVGLVCAALCGGFLARTLAYFWEAGQMAAGWVWR